MYLPVMVPNVELHQVKDLGRLCTVCLKKQDFRILQLVSSSKKFVLALILCILFRKLVCMSCVFMFLPFTLHLVEAGASISDSEKSCATWKLHYYEWAMQIFERYNISEGACQFAYAALEQVDEAINFMESSENVLLPTYSRGRLWANVFKFTLDLNLLNDAYCAIISNPDEEIKRICLRRFIIVLFECGKTKVEVKKFSSLAFLNYSFYFFFGKWGPKPQEDIFSILSVTTRTFQTIITIIVINSAIALCC